MNVSRYLPLDELLEQPRVRILRVLRHFDAVTLLELLETLNEPEYHPYWHAMERLLRDGHVIRVGRLHAITASGRELYEQLMGRTLIDDHGGRRYSKNYRSRAAEANVCINGPLIGNVGRRGVVHGPPGKNGRCERCEAVAKKSRHRVTEAA
jgi:hypothetical protein